MFSHQILLSNNLIPCESLKEFHPFFLIFAELCFKDHEKITLSLIKKIKLNVNFIRGVFINKRVF